MNRSKRTLVLTGLVVGAIAFAVSGSAWSGSKGHSGHGLERLERGVSQLELSDEVENSINGIIAEARAAQEERRPELDEAHEQMRALMDADAPDEAAVLAQVDRIGALKTEARKVQLTTLLRVRALLTPEQRTSLEERKRGRDHRRGEER